jgi:hypothetical protein
MIFLMNKVNIIVKIKINPNIHLKIQYIKNKLNKIIKHNKI